MTLTLAGFAAHLSPLVDPPLAMAVLDRIVDGAIVLKLTGES